MAIDWTARKYPECQGCTLLAQPGPVLGVGDPRTAVFVYNAQNPGWHECFEEDGTPRKRMEPLVGPSGRVFNRQLFESGVKRSELYITNQVKCLTPNNRPPTDLEVRKCRHLFEKELTACKSDVVMLAGATAFKTNVGTYSSISNHYHPTDSVMERMGCVELRNGRKWIGNIHPAFIMRMNMFMEEANEFLRKAWKLSGVTIPTININTHPSDQEVREYGREAVANGSFADDVETTQIERDVEEDDYVGGDWIVTMYGVSCRPYHAIVMNPDQIPIFAEMAWKEPTVTQYEHNMEYEGYYLPRFGSLRNKRFDTMLAHHWLFNTSRKYLKPNCVRRYTNLPYYHRDLGELDERLYNGFDCIATYLTGEQQTRLLKQEGLWDLIWEYGFPMLPILEGWRVKGINVDVRKALLFKRIYDGKVQQVEGMLAQMLGPMFNWNSPKQVRELFYDKWHLPVQYNTKDRVKKVTVDDEARQTLAKWINATTERKEQHKQAAIAFTLLDVAHKFKNLSDYFNRISPDGRIHAYWKAHGAETFRLASKPNVQNWPTWSIGKTTEGVDLGSPRSVVIPDYPEDVLISTDFEQFELWCYAKIWNIKNLLKIYESGEYIHGIAYEQVLKKPFFEPGKPRTKKYRLPSVTDIELLRAKAVPLGFQYARSGESVAAEHGWPSIEGVRYRNEWFKPNPEYPQSHAKIKFEATQKGRLRPPPGLLLHYPQFKLQAINCYGQTPTAMILCQSIIMIEKEFKRRELPHARTVLCVHDSILTNCREQDAEEIHDDIINPILTRPIPWLGDFRFRYEAKVGKMWDWGMESYDKWKTNKQSVNQSSLGTIS